jgi:tetratricopeptide (TPR) repeat protein
MTGAMTLQTRLGEALALAQAGQADRATALLDRILQAVPGEPDALQLLGMIARGRGDNVSAADYLRRSLASRPGQAPLLNTLGNTLLDLGQLDEAIAAYHQAVALQPRFGDAFTNLGLACLGAGRGDDAVEALDRAVTIDPANAKAWAALGRAHGFLGLRDKALAAFRRSLALRPQHVPTLHNFAVALRLAGQAAEAVALLERCAAADRQSAEIRYNLGHCHYDLGQLDHAATAYAAAVALAPGYRDAHDALNRLYWQTGNTDAYLASYIDALERDPSDAGLLADFAQRLNLGGRSAQAAALLEDAIARGIEDGGIHEQLGQACLAQGRLDDAIARYRAAIALEPAAIGPRLRLVGALIRDARQAEALDALDPVLAHAPFDQQAIAYRALAWRLSGDHRADALLDYGRLVQVRRLVPPPEWGDVAAFNRRLEAALVGLHVTREHPLEQTVRGGTQTMGELFDVPLPEVQAVRAMIEAAVRDYIDALPDDADHPFLCRKTGGFRVAGSWSVRLRSQGYHLNHIHPEGWISSAYYVGLPPESGDAGDRAGWIKFGETSLDLARQESIARCVRPEVGMLVLFPSYLYHGTIPFAGDAFRTTVAFDIVPS